MRVFSYTYNSALHEYEIYLGDEIFCHLSEGDFDIFLKIVTKSGNRLVVRGKA
jgi:hypothetical protein